MEINWGIFRELISEFVHLGAAWLNVRGLLGPGGGLGSSEWYSDDITTFSLLKNLFWLGSDLDQGLNVRLLDSLYLNVEIVFF